MKNLTLSQRLNGGFAIVSGVYFVAALIEGSPLLVLVAITAVVQVLGVFISRTIKRNVESNAKQLAGSVTTLLETSQHIEQTSGFAADQARAVTVASAQVNSNITTVAAAVDEMHASIAEIARAAGDATRVASEAVQTVRATNETVAQLGTSSAEIGKVIEVITSIAEQTNLLALNATIEAARAGEAGKGFAVVANEVKELAKETAAATDEISRRIAAIQTDTNGAVSAIEDVSAIITQINDIQSTIASAVEEQTATTTEISRSVQEGARGTADMEQSIETFAMTAQDAADSASANRVVVDALREVMHGLAELVGHEVDGIGGSTVQRSEPRTSSHVAQSRRDMTGDPAPRDVVDWADPDALAEHGSPAVNGKYRLSS